MTKGWGKYEPTGVEIFCSPSRLIAFRESPLVYKDKYIDKVTKDTKSMEFGTLVHKMVLEPETFHEKYLVLPEKTDENSLDSKALEALCKDLGLKVSGTKAEKITRIREVNPDFPLQYDELIDALPQGLVMVPPSDINAAKAISERIRANEKVGPWIKLAEKEKRGFYTDEKTGIVIRFQIDAFFEHKGVGVITDLKITRDWQQRNFECNLYKSGIATQLAMYRRALKQIEGKEFSAFLIIAVEPSKPHRVRYYQVNSETLDASDLEIDLLLKEYKIALETNNFDERKSDKEIQTVSFKDWDWQRFNDLEVHSE